MSNIIKYSQTNQQTKYDEFFHSWACSPVTPRIKNS